MILLYFGSLFFNFPPVRKRVNRLWCLSFKVLATEPFLRLEVPRWRRSTYYQYLIPLFSETGKVFGSWSVKSVVLDTNGKYYRRTMRLFMLLQLQKVLPLRYFFYSQPPFQKRGVGRLPQFGWGWTLWLIKNGSVNWLITLTNAIFLQKGTICLSNIAKGSLGILYVVSFCIRFCILSRIKILCWVTASSWRCIQWVGPIPRAHLVIALLTNLVQLSNSMRHIRIALIFILLTLISPSWQFTQYVEDPSSCAIIGDPDVYGPGVRISYYLSFWAGIIAMIADHDDALRDVRKGLLIIGCAVLITLIRNAVQGSFAVFEWYVLSPLVIILPITLIPNFDVKIAPKDLGSLGAWVCLYGIFLMLQPWIWWVKLHQGTRPSCNPKALIYAVFNLYNSKFIRFNKVMSIISCVGGPFPLSSVEVLPWLSCKLETWNSIFLPYFKRNIKRDNLTCSRAQVRWWKLPRWSFCHQEGFRWLFSRNWYWRRIWWIWMGLRSRVPANCCRSW